VLCAERTDPELFLLFDIAEEIDLRRLHTLLGSSPAKREPAFRHPAPEYVRYEQPPVLQTMGERDFFDGSAVQSASGISAMALPA